MALFFFVVTSQKDVDDADTFSIVLQRVEDWLDQHRYVSDVIERLVTS